MGRQQVLLFIVVGFVVGYFSSYVEVGPQPNVVQTFQGHYSKPVEETKPLVFTEDVKPWPCDGELPPGQAQCQHSVPSVVDFLNARRSGDMCSWWSGAVGRGEIAPKRLGVKAGNIPPRSFCTSDRVCVHKQELCLGHTLPSGLPPRHLSFCPHHDGPAVLELVPCPKSISCNARTSVKPNTAAGHPGSGRNIVSIQHRWLADGGNVWHWVTSLLDIFGAVVEADPSVLDATGNFTRTAAQISIMTLTGAFHKDRKIYKMGGNKGFRSAWGPRAEQSRGFLEKLSLLPVEYTNPEVDRCFENAVVGTPMETYLQWEDAAFSPRQQFRMAAYAQFLIRVALGTFGAADGPKKAPALPIAAPWAAVYEARTRPRMLVMTRGEDKKPYTPPDDSRTRMMLGFERLQPTAHFLGFDMVLSNPDTTLSEQILAAASADVIVGVHGAALAWAVVLPAHGVLVEMRTQLRLVDRAFIYPQLCASRGLSYIVWTPSYPVIPSKDKRLPFDTVFNVTDEAALFHLTLAKRELLDKAPFLDITGAQQNPR